MRRAIVTSILAVVLGLSAVKLSAESSPTLSGTAFGIELCPQFICGFALFAGGFEGEVNSRPASGGFAAGIVHEDLPPIGQFAAILGGQWTISAGHRRFRGDVIGGQILNLNDTQYCVSMAMKMTHGGRGEIYFTGLLDHGPFPPTIGGFVTQEPTGSPCPSVGAATDN